MRRFKNAVKVLVGKGNVDRANVVYEVPCDPEEARGHLDSLGVRHVRTYGRADAQLSTIDHDTTPYARLVFVVKV